MACYLTDARQALLAALQTDTQIASLVKTWFEFSRALVQRFEIEPAQCTAYAVHPGRVFEPEVRYNAAYDMRQEIIVLITTDGQIPDACEELIALTQDRVKACRQNMLGLAADGLTNLRAPASMDPYPQPDTARLMWQAVITVTLDWIRFL